jgi:uncharacterized protein (DUF4213/DUF364 family)
MIVDETIDLLKTKYRENIEHLFIKEVRIGVCLTAVVLSDNSIGISSTSSCIDHDNSHKSRDFGAFSPGNIAGKAIIELLENQKKTCYFDSLKIAVLNAVSSRFFSNSAYEILPKTDPIDILDLNSNKTITVVGAFQSYIKKIACTNSKLFVLELNENAFKDEDKKYYVPADEFKKVVPLSDILIITGLTLVNNTLDKLLSSAKPQSQIIITGPSSSLLPDVLFAKKVNMIGAVRITDPEQALKLVSEGAAAYHLFRYCAEKICILNK